MEINNPNLEKILNCINSEPKTLALLHLDEVPIGPTILRNRVGDTVKDLDIIPKKSSFKNYCLRNFLQAELISIDEEEEKTRVVQKYGLTSLGKEYGQPLAAFTLKYAVDNEMSLNLLWGISPEVRLKVLETLAREKLLGRPELMKSVGVDHPSLLIHLKALEDLNFIKYESIGQSAEQGIKYKLTGKDPSSLQPQGNRRKVMKQILDSLKRMGEGTYQEIAGQIGRAENPLIHPSLKELCNRGYATQSRWVHGDYESEGRILPAGYKFLADYLKPLQEALSNRESLDRIRKVYEMFIKNPEIFRDYAIKGMTRHNQVSGNVNAIRN